MQSVPIFFFSSLSDFFGCGSSRGYNISLNTVSATWPLANRAIYHPFYLPWRYPIKRLFWLNGSSASGNADVGIYSVGGTRIVSTGSTAQSGASTAQYVSADLVLPPGTYYLGNVFSGTTNVATSIGSITAIAGRMQGVLQEGLGSTTLPATMSPSTFTGSVVPVAGFTLSPSW